MSAPIYVAVSAQVASTGATQNVAWPTGHQIGDLGIVVIETTGNGVTLTPPAGWTALSGTPVVDLATIAGSKLHVWYRFATSTAMAAVATGAATDHLVARMYSFRDVSESAPFNVTTIGTKNVGTASTAVTWPSVTTTVNDTLVVHIAGRPNDSSSTTAFATYTAGSLGAALVEAAEAGTTSGNGGGFTLAYANKATAGSTGTPTAVGPSTTTLTYVVFALRTKSFTLTADTQSYNETLQPANLLLGRDITASTQAYDLAGSDVTLTKTSAARILTAETATFTEDLKPANLNVSRTLSCASATYIEDLKPANLLLGRKLLAVGEREQQVFTDDFERADQALDSTSAWLRADLEVGSLSIVSGKAVGTNIGNVYNQTLANNQWAEIRFGGVFASGTGKGAAILLRATGGQSSFTGYAISLERDNSEAGDILSIRRVLGATTYTDAFSQGALLTSTRVAEFSSFSPDTIIRAEIIDGIIYAYVNGVLALTSTASGSPVSGFAGIWSDTATISTFSAGGIGPTRLTLNNANLIVGRKLVSATGSYTEDLKPANLIAARSLTAKTFADEQLFSDDFTGTAGLLGSQYTQQGDVNLRLDGLGNVHSLANGRSIAWPNTVSFESSQYAEITLTEISYAASAGSGLVLRIQTNESPSVEKSYIFRTGNAGEAYAVAKYNEASGVVTLRTTTLIPVVGDRLRAVATGDTLYFYVNDQLIATQSDISWPGGVPGIYGFNQQWKSDNFVAGNYGGLHLAGTYTNTRAARRLVCASATYTEDLKPANLIVGKNLTADVQSYTLELKDATLTKTVTARTLVADTASYAEDLKPANLKVGKRLVADTGSYAEDLKPANLLLGRRLVADTASYNETLRDANLLRGRRLIADTASYAEDLKPANLKVGKRLVADTASYTEDLKPAILKAGKRLVADTASYNETLRDANLLCGRRLVADTASYNETLRDANLKAGKRLVADRRTYSISTSETTFRFARKIIAQQQTYTLTGFTPSFKLLGKLAADTASYSLTGNTVNLLRSLKLSANFASYSFNGNAVTLSRGKKIVADTASYNENLQPANLRLTRRLPAEEFRANYIRNSMMVGTVAGTPGTAPSLWSTATPAWCTRTIVGTGVDSTTGLTYIDVSLSGTNNSGVEQAIVLDPVINSNIIAEKGQVWISSAYFGLISGSWPVSAVYIGSVSRNSSLTWIDSGTTSIKGVTGSLLQRISATHTVSSADARYIQTVIRFSVLANDNVNLTIRIAAPQLERGSVARAFIPTTNAVAYRWFELAGQSVNLLENSRLIAESRSYALTGNATNLARGKKLVADTQTYNENLQPANLKVGKRLVADTASYNETLRDANLKVGRRLVADTASYNETLRDANLLRGRRLVADTASYNETLRDATLKVTRRLVADTRSYALTGNNFFFGTAGKITADTRSYALTGNSANLLKSTIVGTQHFRANLIPNSQATGAVVGVIGSGGALPTGWAYQNGGGVIRDIIATGTMPNGDAYIDIRWYGTNNTGSTQYPGIFFSQGPASHQARAGDKFTGSLYLSVLSGSTTGFSYAPNKFTLFGGNPSNFTQGTTSAVINGTRVSASLSLTDIRTTTIRMGIDVALLNGSSVDITVRISAPQVEPGLTATAYIPTTGTQVFRDYSFAGNNINITAVRKVTADKATYTLTGRTANILAGERGPSDSRNFILTGNNIRFNRSVKSVVSSYTLTRNDANLRVGRKVSLSLSSYIVSGKAANLLANRKVQAARSFYDTDGYVAPGYTDPNYAAIDIAIRSGRKLAAAKVDFALNGIEINVTRGGFIKVWNGSAWVSKPLKVWNGAAWVSKPLKIWNGTTWQIY